MKRIIILFALATSLINCKAQQQIYPLNTFYKNAPNYAYMKDINNDLPPYIGTYKATYQGNEIILYITKEDHLLIGTSGVRKYYQDVLHVKYIVKKIATGVILEDGQNTIKPKEKKIISIGTNIQDGNSIALLYSGTSCGIGWGRITIKKISSTQINWSYYPNDSLFSNGECSSNLDKKVYLPVTENLFLLSSNIKPL